MRVLLVDTELNGRARAIASSFALRDHHLVRCADADEARAAIEESSFDLIAVVGDDDPSGLLALCAALRAVAGDTFLLALVSTHDPEIVGLLLDAGVDDCFGLPFEPRRFTARLRVVERTLEQRARLREAEREAKEVNARLLLADRLVSVGTLAAGVAHEINNPLMYVIANLEFVSRQLASADGSGVGERRERVLRALSQAREGADRVSQIVRSLRTFSRGDEDRRGPVSVTDVMESSLAMAWNEVRHRARLVRDYLPVAPVEANEARLGQVFLNLVVNAAQAIPEGRVDDHEIRVSAREASGKVIVEVSDTGAGIPREIIGRIFDPFFTTKPVGEGTGLGLSICHGIVKNLGGEIVVERNVTRGTTFRVVLPAAAPVRAVVRTSTPPAPLGARARVLIVDDEPNLRLSLAQILATEHDVRETASGHEVLDMMREGVRFDVILCDLLMPEMSGVDLFQALESVAPEQCKRVVFLTGGAFTPRAQEFLARIANPRLEKPFDIDELLVLIRKVMR